MPFPNLPLHPVFLAGAAGIATILLTAAIVIFRRDYRRQRARRRELWRNFTWRPPSSADPSVPPAPPPTIGQYHQTDDKTGTELTSAALAAVRADKPAPDHPPHHRWRNHSNQPYTYVNHDETTVTYINNPIIRAALGTANLYPASWRKLIHALLHQASHQHATTAHVPLLPDVATKHILNQLNLQPQPGAGNRASIVVPHLDAHLPKPDARQCANLVQRLVNLTGCPVHIVLTRAQPTQAITFRPKPPTAPPTLTTESNTWQSVFPVAPATTNSTIGGIILALALLFSPPLHAQMTSPPWQCENRAPAPKVPPSRPQPSSAPATANSYRTPITPWRTSTKPGICKPSVTACPNPN